MPRYVDTFEEEEEIDIATVQVEIEKLEKNLACNEKNPRYQLKHLSARVPWHDAK